jgi:hypothetical protein
MLIKEKALSLSKKMGDEYCNEMKFCSTNANEVMRHARKKLRFFPFGRGGRFQNFDVPNNSPHYPIAFAQS